MIFGSPKDGVNNKILDNPIAKIMIVMIYDYGFGHK